MVLCKDLRVAGTEVDVERQVPQLYKWEDGKCAETIMDPVVHWPGTCHLVHVDVTVRCPHAEHYAVAHKQVGAAADKGEQDKRKRYGSAVHPVCMETYRRMGSNAN